MILGVSATIHPLTMGGITTLDVAMVVLSSLLLFVAAFTFRRKAVDRWEGAIFVAIYAAIELLLGWRGAGNVAHFARGRHRCGGWQLLWWWRRRGLIRF